MNDAICECLAVLPDILIPGQRVAREPAALTECRGRSGMIVSDNRSEPTSDAILKWCAEHKIE